jgi:hypothetical protein
VEVVADDDVANAEGVDQDFADEVLRGQSGQICIEGEHNAKVEAEACQQLQLALERREAEQRLVGLEEFARVGLEHDRARGAAELACVILRHLQQRLVTAVHTVKIADRECTAARCGRNLGYASENPHEPLRGC